MPATDADVAIRPQVPWLEILNPAGNLGEIWCTFHRIRHGRKENIRISLLHMLDSIFDIADFLSFISPHQKDSTLNSTLPAESHCRLNLLRRDATLHRVQNPLRATLGTNPNTEATQFCECIGNLRIDPVRARRALKRQPHSSLLDFSSVLKQPAGVNGKDIVGHPRDVGVIPLN